ncbi:7733_t:CDS:2 [Funneliformis geosporum]|nr:7733_t:CDS:2 [Funneliformis geosporum]
MNSNLSNSIVVKIFMPVPHLRKKWTRSNIWKFIEKMMRKTRRERDLQQISYTIQAKRRKRSNAKFHVLYLPIFASQANCLLDEHTKAHQIFQKTSKSNQRIVDIKQTKDHKRNKQPTLSSIPKSLEWKYDTTRNMTVCKLRGNESVSILSH